MNDTEWSGERVMERLTEAFRLLPDTPIYSVRGRLALPPAAELIRATAECLGEKSLARTQLLSFARAYAAAEPIAELCRERLWRRTTAYRRVDWAAAHVAHCLNQAALDRQISQTLSALDIETPPA
jgi:hypothetical protein